MSKLHNMDLVGFLACARFGVKPTQHKLDGFSEACYNDNSVNELIDALKSRAADEEDCENWEITKKAWREEIRTALEHAMFEYVSDNDLK